MNEALLITPPPSPVLIEDTVGDNTPPAISAVTPSLMDSTPAVPRMEPLNPQEILAVVEVGSYRVTCAVARAGISKPVLLAVESVPSYGIRDGEIIDMDRASESIRIAVEVASRRCGLPVERAVIGFSGDARMSISRGSLPLTGQRRAVKTSDLVCLRGGLYPENASKRRTIHRFDGPYSVGELHGVERPVGLHGSSLAMQSMFLTAPTGFLANLRQAVHRAGIQAEALAIQPYAASLGTLTADERALGAAVLDFGGGGFRGALWEGGRLKQFTTGGVDKHTPAAPPTGVMPAPGGMEGMLVHLARRFRISPSTARCLVLDYGYIGSTPGSESLQPRRKTAILNGMNGPCVEVTSVDGISKVRVELDALSVALEEMFVPVIRGLRDGLPQFSGGHAAGIVLVGQGATLKGLPELVSRHFGGATTRLGVPRWEVNLIPDRNPHFGPSEGSSSKKSSRRILDQSISGSHSLDLDGPGACGLCGLVTFGLDRRTREGEPEQIGWWSWIRGNLRRAVAMF